MALQYADEGLRRDRDFVLEAAGRSSWAVQYASEELRLDRAFVLEALSRNSRAPPHHDEKALDRYSQAVLAWVPGGPSQAAAANPDAGAARTAPVAAGA